MGTSHDWAVWRRASKDKHPVRHWIVEEGLDHLQNFVYWPADKLNDIRYYINNRWITKSHALTAHPRDIKPGTWSDVGNRFLPCLFNELVDFVEIEQAWHHCMWDEEARVKFAVPWYRKGWLRLRTWRCPEAGVEHLNWAKSLVMNESYGTSPNDPNFGKPTSQAEGATEILALYNWWKFDRPTRPDPYQASGWRDICEKRRIDYPDEILPDEKTEDERKATNDALDFLHELEAKYDKEDEEMMIRLIKIRDYLWT